MRDRGTLYAGDDTGGITAVVILDNDVVALEVDGEAWGNWHVSIVEISAIGSNEFRLDLGEDIVRFTPDRRLDFAYTTVPAFQKAKAEAGKGFRGRRRVKKVARDLAHGATAAPSSAPISAVLAPSPGPAVPASLSQDNPSSHDREGADPFASPKPDSIVAAEVPADPFDAGLAEPASQTSAATAEPLDASPVDPDVAALRAAAQSLAAASSPESPNPGEVVIDLRSAVVPPATPPAIETSAAVPATPSAQDSKPTHAAPPSSEASRTGMRLLDRVRQSRAEHIHDYTVSSSGVMVRRVCRECNHVSIGTSD